MRYLQNQNTLMQFIVFAITYPIIWLFSRLPMRVLYIKSDIFFFLIYYVFGYRKKVVLQNISYAFPEKSKAEKKKIAKKFFHHFTDLFVESIKAFSISEKQVVKRYTYKNPELIEKYIKEGKSIALVGAHLANWEWSFNLPLFIDCKINGAYTSLGNKYFDKIVKNSREKFGYNCYKSSKTVRAIHRDYSNKIQGVYLLLSDQSPQLEHTVYWQKFLNVNVPIYTGAESLAKRFNLVVINCLTKKIKRGYYEAEFQLITDKPNEFENYKITDKYIKLTEENIKNQPEFYLWSHNRFKHRNRLEEWKKLKISKSKSKN
jgi:KDO2-lipid IV(A) lauroyltransferase